MCKSQILDGRLVDLIPMHQIRLTSKMSRNANSTNDKSKSKTGCKLVKKKLTSLSYAYSIWRELLKTCFVVLLGPNWESWSRLHEQEVHFMYRLFFLFFCSFLSFFSCTDWNRAHLDRIGKIQYDHIKDAIVSELATQLRSSELSHFQECATYSSNCFFASS
eukprot:SAG31_NODE_1115_length_9839_cov_39.294661_5_plen_162_part_00